MYAATVVVSIALALVLLYTAFATFTGTETVRRGVIGVGFPPSFMWLLGVAQFAGAVGIVVGLWWPPLGIAAAIGLVLYFLCAVTAHIRVRHPRRAVTPSAAILVGSIATLALIILTG
jgi:hypothetical protein